MITVIVLDFLSFFLFRVNFLVFVDVLETCVILRLLLGCSQLILSYVVEIYGHHLIKTDERLFVFLGLDSSLRDNVESLLNRSKFDLRHIDVIALCCCRDCLWLFVII